MVRAALSSAGWLLRAPGARCSGVPGWPPASSQGHGKCWKPTKRTQTPRTGLATAPGDLVTGQIVFLKSQVFDSPIFTVILLILSTVNHINTNAFLVLTPEVLWKCQIYAELKEEEVPGQENRAGLEPISTTCFRLIGLLQLLLKSRLLPSHFVDGRTGTVFIKCNVILDHYPQSFFTLFLLSLRKQNDAHPDSSEENKFCKVLVES